MQSRETLIIDIPTTAENSRACSKVKPFIRGLKTQVFSPHAVAPLAWSVAGVRQQAAHPRHSTRLAKRRRR